ncbi:MAG TPA: EscE/YscE/SsaE family type III secretion system needle protein co-chaperone [Desulfosporosinus sp.]|nr:EscE/YscE/SsaE family type III secretion system needle protein co-chaperone [Desulfosporosinus sp.]
MEKKNAKQHVQDVTNHLQSAQNCLNTALGSVEKPENKQEIQNTLNAVNGALQTANTTLTNYKG